MFMYVCMYVRLCFLHSSLNRFVIGGDDDNDLSSGELSAIIVCSVLGFIFLCTLLYFHFGRSIKQETVKNPLLGPSSSTSTAAFSPHGKV